MAVMAWIPALQEIAIASWGGYMISNLYNAFTDMGTGGHRHSNIPPAPSQGQVEERIYKARVRW